MEVKIPKLGAAMLEGTLVEWLVADGQAVTPDTVIYTIETDKISNEISAPTTGVIRLLAEPGADYPVGTVIAEIR
jgi:pyruvate dehydrogenase E2 component (dihydrolipoamide acetyltransferase)